VWINPHRPCFFVRKKLEREELKIQHEPTANFRKMGRGCFQMVFMHGVFSIALPGLSNTFRTRWFLLFLNRDISETCQPQRACILARSMTVERHLILQELALRPSGEWTPQIRGWVVARVAEGVGYWLHGGNARELNVGDGFIVGINTGSLLRSSQLGPLKFQFFTVQPQYLNGVLTVAEWHQLEAAANNPSTHVLIFNAGEPVGQKFSRLAEQSNSDGPSMRCALLQLWVNAVAGLLAAPASDSSGGNKLHGRFRQVVGKMTEAELSESSLADLAGQLHCSERHFSRLFRGEFGVPFRARQIELRLQRAQQLLTGSDDKIINVAYESGYRHLGLFNAMFKKRFGVTPGEWRQQNAAKNIPTQPRSHFSRMVAGITALLLVSLFFLTPVMAQTNSNPGDTEAIAQARNALLQKMAEADAAEKQAEIENENARKRLETEEMFGKVHRVPVSTNAGPRFKVEKYLVTGNSILPPGIVGGILTNVPDAFGTDVALDGVRAALGDLQMAYRERGYVTVSVALPPQKLTNAEVKVKVTEGRLDAINVTGNRWFSTENVLRALPSLHTNMLLNSHVFQRELDQANASRDRQIYPVIGPGPEPGTSALTLKVKDQFPLHARTELNNDNTPGTPELRENSTVQYDNLWNLNHQVGLQYTFSPEQFKRNDYFNETPFDDPLIANYSAYYRLPLTSISSVEQKVENNPSSFGYNEVTHKFNLPPATGQPELNFYASRSTSDTGVQFAPKTTVTNTPLITIQSQDTGENLTLNSDVGGRLSIPLRQFAGISSTLSAGLDYKNYETVSYNTNNFITTSFVTNNGSVTKISNTFSTGQPVRKAELNYLPLNIGLSGSVLDALGTSFFNATVNFNPFNGGGFSNNKDFSRVAYSANARASYVTLQMGADRVQTIYKEWSVKFHADGQWANGPLINDEQYAIGGTAGVRGYLNGEGYGDDGWRVSVEPRTPQLNIGMFGNEGHEEPCWVRGSVFMDYGEIYLIDPAANLDYWGTGFGVTANIGNHLDARLTVAWPLISHTLASAGTTQVYFGVGMQF
jgi:hemolysin activation/secretion protein/AraC-like DNA-binding protein